MVQHADIDHTGITGVGSSADEKAKVSANDTTAGYLNGKLVAGTNVTLTENSDGGNETLTIAASASGGTVYPFTDMDEPPASPNAANMEGTSMTGWSFLTSSGSVTEASGIFTQLFGDDSGPANPTWNVDSDIADHLVMHCLNSGKFAAYRAWAPTASTNWMMGAKVRFFPGLNSATSDSRLMVGVTSDGTPSIASGEVANSIAAELRTSTTIFTHALIRPSSRTNESGSITPVLYVGITGRSDNSIQVWVSPDGQAWRRKGAISSGTAPAGSGTVANAFIYLHDLSATGQGPLVIVDWVRFKAGSNNLLELGGGR